VDLAELFRALRAVALDDLVEDVLGGLAPTRRAVFVAQREEELAIVRPQLARAIERIRGELREIHTEHSKIRDLVDVSFHPYWGSLLKQDNELSIFGQQVETYADVYMRRVSCLRHYSPMQFFRSPHDLMPHEL